MTVGECRLRSSSNQKIGSLIPGPAKPHVGVSLGKAINSNIVSVAVTTLSEYKWKVGTV